MHYCVIISGLEIIVDLIDKPLIDQFKWYLVPQRSKNKKWYVRTCIYQKTYYLSRLILNCKKGEFVIHKNTNTLDFRRENLIIKKKGAIRNPRPVNFRSNFQEHKNTLKKTLKDGSHKYQSFICVNKRLNYLGTFDTGELASECAENYRLALNNLDKTDYPGIFTSKIISNYRKKYFLFIIYDEIELLMGVYLSLRLAITARNVVNKNTGLYEYEDPDFILKENEKKQSSKIHLIPYKQLYYQTPEDIEDEKIIKLIIEGQIDLIWPLLNKYKEFHLRLLKFNFKNYFTSAHEKSTTLQDVYQDSIINIVQFFNDKKKYTHSSFKEWSLHLIINVGYKQFYNKKDLKTDHLKQRHL